MPTDNINGLVCAECRACELKHLYRQRNEHTQGVASTECPACRSVRYRTFIADTVPDELADREAELETILEDVDGVGAQMVKNIKDEYQPLLRLETTTVEELSSVSYVGETTAERILDHI